MQIKYTFIHVLVVKFVRKIILLTLNSTLMHIRKPINFFLFVNVSFLWSLNEWGASSKLGSSRIPSFICISRQILYCAQPLDGEEIKCRGGKSKCTTTLKLLLLVFSPRTNFKGNLPLNFSDWHAFEMDLSLNASNMVCSVSDSSTQTIMFKRKFKIGRPKIK